MAKISILVPIYNVEKYLEQCLTSLIGQTFKDIEIICINDGSTDSSKQIIESFMKDDNRIRLIDKENSGYGDSMNKGLECATGEYIGILESDDFAETNMFEDLYNLVTKHIADIVLSDFYKYWANKTPKKVNSTSKFPIKKVTNIKECPIILRNKTTIWSGIYKKDFLNKYKIKFLPTPGASYQDTSFRLKTIALADSIVFTDKAYVYYRQDNMNSSMKSKTKIFSVCEEYDETEQFLNQYPDVMKYAKQEILINKWNGYMWSVKRIDEDFIEQFIERFYEDFKKSYENNEIEPYFYKKIDKNYLKLLLNNRKAFSKIFSINHRNISRLLLLLEIIKLKAG